ncbi:hypothetical protein SNEBB_008480 [Seison nebaliae]|nr:hypothetical protein SNEBB_008480 [Seison nebaliae]
MRSIRHTVSNHSGIRAEFESGYEMEEIYQPLPLVLIRLLYSNCFGDYYFIDDNLRKQPCNKPYRAHLSLHQMHCLIIRDTISNPSKFRKIIWNYQQTYSEDAKEPFFSFYTRERHISILARGLEQKYVYRTMTNMKVQTKIAAFCQYEYIIRDFYFLFEVTSPHIPTKGDQPIIDLCEFYSDLKDSKFHVRSPLTFVSWKMINATHENENSLKCLGIVTVKFKIFSEFEKDQISPMNLISITLPKNNFKLIYIDDEIPNNEKEEQSNDVQYLIFAFFLTLFIFHLIHFYDIYCTKEKKVRLSLKFIESDSTMTTTKKEETIVTKKTRVEFISAISILTEIHELLLKIENFIPYRRKNVVLISKILFYILSTIVMLWLITEPIDVDDESPTLISSSIFSYMTTIRTGIKICFINLIAMALIYTIDNGMAIIISTIIPIHYLTIHIINLLVISNEIFLQKQKENPMTGFNLLLYLATNISIALINLLGGTVIEPIYLEMMETKRGFRQSGSVDCYSTTPLRSTRLYESLTMKLSNIYYSMISIELSSLILCIPT